MLHLSANNTLLEATLIELQQAVQSNSPLVVDRIVSDFDHTSFHLVTPDNDNRQFIHLSIVTKAWPSLTQCGDNENQFIQFINSKLDNKATQFLSKNETTPGYDMTVRVDLSQLTNESIHDLSLLKTHVMSFPFQLAFDEFQQLSQQFATLAPGEEESSLSQPHRGKSHKIQYRDDENIFVQPSSDRITVIFETIFKDETDKIFGKVFLQEFADARKRNRSIQSAPQVLSSNTPPREIASTLIENPDSRFITFVLFPRHFSNAETQFKTIAQILQFRNYFHYHIKCSKAYMHSRMRFRVNTFIKVLNRAKFDSEENEEGEKEPQQRRTFTGRKMVY